MAGLSIRWSSVVVVFVATRGVSNGPCFSPDGHTFYFSDSAARLIYAYPQRAESGTAFVDELKKRNDQKPTSIPATVGELVVCTEVERVPLDNVARQLFHGRPDSMEFASRLHTRTDIAWTHISAMR